MIKDGLNLLREAFFLFLYQRPLYFWLTLLFSFFLAGFCWWLASHYTQLWNRTFKVKLVHHFFCGIASLMTFIFVSTFFCLGFTKTAGRDQINRWGYELVRNEEWENRTFEQARRAVWNLGIEPAYEWTNPHIIPTTTYQSRLTVATIYVSNATKSFLSMHPFLGKILDLNITKAETLAKKDMDAYFALGGTTYDDRRAIGLISSYLIWSLDQQTPRLSFLFRVLLVVLFLFTQSIPFTLIGIAAYRDIKIQT
ncbi:hypothetical protein A7K93_07210 [Candidatus Methylacidiphilum fumarolicum]|uniref:Uncharacterized protein n=2 Tax=Candidatus Methylacidiphilum fumarolicum TaxID=591154 RepID=I0JY38_METFB|nr:hypothetical protein [Candidatus Methylacidiphilum fumarolicum]MBW6415571.1 hypothetical protein [Candidatus Methylacidiphilum fumarolicum]TFE68460.1 hypothetical protein A7K73_07795 [Candidatus Methylacidiphilum fumarolicum]TFE73064.1 hypothetical protein A7K93_07210 [Candidatus Methylacidiphilum fumarolicum]TFE73120.1 hypothetical protein A7K72_07240 [Candidatus Methylacidiphilum fumarolicum]TFE77083.1 hypothetical protein A7D33_06585 [Candidatus Methylacidiphilum fumarolicum]